MIITDAGKVFANVRFDEPVEAPAPNVRFIDCRFYGHDPNQALLRTGPGTEVDHCLMVGSPAGQRVGIRAESANVRILSTPIRNIFHVSDAQAISGDNGTANLTIDGCYLEASGENIIFGGSDPTSEANVPQDILIRGCTLTKPLKWRGMAGATFKNLFELKNAKRVTFEDNVLSNSWVHGQVGFGIVLTVRNQNNTAPYSTLQDIVIRRNVIRACAGGVQILGQDYTNPSARAARMTIEDNEFELDPATFGANGRVFQIQDGPSSLCIRRNVVTGSGLNSFLILQGLPLEGFQYVDNDTPEGEYGLIGVDPVTGSFFGPSVMTRQAPGYAWSGNTVRRTVGACSYPAGTTVVS